MFKMHWSRDLVCLQRQSEINNNKERKKKRKKERKKEGNEENCVKLWGKKE